MKVLGYCKDQLLCAMRYKKEYWYLLWTGGLLSMTNHILLFYFMTVTSDSSNGP